MPCSPTDETIKAPAKDFLIRQGTDSFTFPRGSQEIIITRLNLKVDDGKAIISSGGVPVSNMTDVSKKYMERTAPMRLYKTSFSLPVDTLTAQIYCL